MSVRYRWPLRHATSSIEISNSSPRRSAGSSSSPTRLMTRPMVSQSTRTSRQVAVRSVLLISHATRSSKSLVNRAPSRANGTPSTCTPCSGQRSRLSRARISSRQTPRSRCRQTESWCCSFSRAIVEYEHFGQTSFLRRNATQTTTWSGSKRTFLTHTPDRSSRRENAAVTRTGDDLPSSTDLDNPRTYGLTSCASHPSPQTAATRTAGGHFFAGIHAGERPLTQAASSPRSRGRNTAHSRVRLTQPSLTVQKPCSGRPSRP